MRSFLSILGLTILLAGCGQAPPPPADDADDSRSTVTVQEWINLLQSSDDKTRLQAAVMLGCKATEAKPALPAMCNALNDRNKYIAATVAKAIAYVDPKGEESLRYLIKAATDPAPVVRQAAVEALCQIGPPAAPAADVLLGLLKEDIFPSVRGAAADALGSIGRTGAAVLPDAALADLRAVEVNDREEDKVRKAARDALLRIPTAK